jgi:cysteine desulfurase/selenocysteine lyase
MELDVARIRRDFPILSREVRPGVALVYLDSTATSQKPRQVIAAEERFYSLHNANIHRGIHTLAEEATAAYEEARSKVGRFIGVANTREIIFTRNTTESINLVANAWGRHFLKSGDLILLTEMEHHSNLVPWQILAEDLGLRLEFIPVTEAGTLDLDAYHFYLDMGPSLVSFTQMSNVLGTITPAKDIIRMAKEAGAATLVDAAQSVPHFPVDVLDLGVDFLAFSAHKMLGPTGIGVLYGRQELLEAMPPFLGGGDMIKRVRLRTFSPNELPYKFEAGTPAIAQAVGFGAAVDYLSSLGMEVVAQHETEIVAYALERLEEIPGLRLLGPPAEYRGGVVSFILDGLHPHDIAQVINEDGIAVRAGHHCAMPLHEKYGIPASTRASFYVYNNLEEVDRLVDSLYRVKKLFA